MKEKNRMLRRCKIYRQGSEWVLEASHIKVLMKNKREVNSLRRFWKEREPEVEKDEMQMQGEVGLLSPMEQAAKEEHYFKMP